MHVQQFRDSARPLPFISAICPTISTYNIYLVNIYSVNHFYLQIVYPRVSNNISFFLFFSFILIICINYYYFICLLLFRACLAFRLIEWYIPQCDSGMQSFKETNLKYVFFAYLFSSFMLFLQCEKIRSNGTLFFFFCLHLSFILRFVWKRNMQIFCSPNFSGRGVDCVVKKINRSMGMILECFENYLMMHLECNIWIREKIKGLLRISCKRNCHYEGRIELYLREKEVWFFL